MDWKSIPKNPTGYYKPSTWKLEDVHAAQGLKSSLKHPSTLQEERVRFQPASDSLSTGLCPAPRAKTRLLPAHVCSYHRLETGHK